MSRKETIIHIILLVIISFGLLLLTQSWWMSLGFLILIVLGDQLYAQWLRKREHKYNREHLKDDLDIKEDE